MQSRPSSPKQTFDVARIQEIEKEVKHDVIAFTTSVAEFVGPESRYVHYGLTSSDVVDTALALQLKAAASLLIEGLNDLCWRLKKRAYEHKMTVMIGRTHGIHAEPTTLGLKITVWYEEARRNLRRLKQAVDNVSVGKISGAVGTFAHLDPQVEEAVCLKLGLQFDSVSTQIVQRDRHAELMAVLAITGSKPGKDCLGSARPAADRGARSGGVLCTWPEGVVRDATQT
jgi:adenylosuccinate lyase